MADHPFVYFFHGEIDPDRLGKVGAVTLAFASPVPERDRIRIQKSVPQAFAGFFKWSDTLFTTESLGDVFDAMVYGESGPGDGEALAEFAAEVEAWVVRVHEKNPLLFFVGPTPVLPGDAWDAWSWSRAPEVVLPFLERYADAHQESLQTDDDDMDASEPMASWGKVDLGQMQALLRF